MLHNYFSISSPAAPREQLLLLFSCFSFWQEYQGHGEKHLKVAEVKYDVSVSLLVSPVFQPEHSWDKLGQPQHLGNDGIAAGNDPQDCLATEVILSQEVQHRDGDPLLHTTMVGMINWPQSWGVWIMRGSQDRRPNGCSIKRTCIEKRKVNIFLKRNVCLCLWNTYTTQKNYVNELWYEEKSVYFPILREKWILVVLDHFLLSSLLLSLGLRPVEWRHTQAKAFLLSWIPLKTP